MLHLWKSVIEPKPVHFVPMMSRSVINQSQIQGQDGMQILLDWSKPSTIVKNWYLVAWIVKCFRKCSQSIAVASLVAHLSKCLQIKVIQSLQPK